MSSSCHNGEVHRPTDPSSAHLDIDLETPCRTLASSLSCPASMSMIRAQEYFAPLRSRHISLQQWERGLLFESWGRRGGRADRRKSGDLDRYMAASDSEEPEIRPVKRVIGRSVSFSAAFGREFGSEAPKTKVYTRGLSLSSSLTSSGEIIPEVSENGSPCLTRRSSMDLSPFESKRSTGLLFSRSFERGRIGPQISDTSSRCLSVCSSDSDRPADRESRPWPKRFFSGSLSFSKDRKFFSGGFSFTKPFGRGSDGLQSWGTSTISSPDHKKAAGSTRTSFEINQDSRLKKKFFARVLAFSRSLDPRGENSSEEVRGPSTLSKVTEIEENKFVGRGLSFSRSLDPNFNGSILSSEVCSAGSSNSGSLTSDCKPPENLSWSRKFISRSGLFFSRSLDPRRSARESASDMSGTGRWSEKDPTELRSKKVFGRGFSFSFSRFLDRNGASTSSNPGTTTGPESTSVEKESQFKSFFRRGLFFSNNSRTLDQARDQASSFGAAACGSTGRSSGNNNNNNSYTKSLSKKFFSRDWSWSRSASRSTSPSKTSPPTANNPGHSFQAGANSLTFPRNSQALKYWWSKRSQSTSGVTSTSGPGNDPNSRLVLLEKVPAAGDQESDELTVYVGERGGSLTKYVLAKQILRHHLFQVLLKCSQDELGSDYDYNSGVPIICDPALFLQVARVVGGNFSAETQLCT